jgi:sulfur-oxidizing protein SoxX
MRVAVAAVIVAATLTAASSQQGGVDPGRVDAVVRSSFPTAAADWQGRLTPDETMRQCSAHHNNPPAAVARAIQERERATIVYPADGGLIGDWRKGEALAQSGYGLRFTDYPPRTVNGGNCYACHQISRQEVSYGTLGPSLMGYGKQRGFGEAEVKAVYERIYNPHAVFPCSNMPRFGGNKILTIEQIKDAVALLMSPDSPINK